VLSREVIEAAIAGARTRGAPVVVDPNGRDYRRYAGATVLTPNLRETEIAAEMTVASEADLEAAAAALVDQTAGAALAVTRESKGISIFRKIDGQLVHNHVPTIPVAVYDVTGAGDAVVASLAIALASGIEMENACALANLAGRAVVRQFGVGTISIGHLIAEASQSVEQTGKVIDLARAQEKVREVRRAGGKVVFTNGCFDVLHFGHAYLLQFARDRGDFLILGLNTDDSVRRQKGPGRPFVPDDQRAYMLSLYPFVDIVILFDEDTPLALIEALQPDILVKGGDYTPDTVVGRGLVESYGGDVVICPRIDGLSTSDLVKKIRERRDEDHAA
jgi:D-beta-D-heptose 7-phosphate kinase/D-beta-D-heptose 1-phosphate adenosyltransferase